MYFTGSHECVWKIDFRWALQLQCSDHFHQLRACDTYIQMICNNRLTCNSSVFLPPHSTDVLQRYMCNEVITSSTTMWVISTCLTTDSILSNLSLATSGSHNKESLMSRDTKTCPCTPKYSLFTPPIPRLSWDDTVQPRSIPGFPSYFPHPRIIPGGHSVPPLIQVSWDSLVTSPIPG